MVPRAHEADQAPSVAVAGDPLTVGRPGCSVREGLEQGVQRGRPLPGVPRAPPGVRAQGGRPVAQVSERGARSRVPMRIPHRLTPANGVLRPNVSEPPCQRLRRHEVVPVAIAASLVHLCNHRHELHLPPSRSRRRNRSQSDQIATYFLLRLRTRSGERLESNVPTRVVLVSWHCPSHPPPTTYALRMRRRCLEFQMPRPSWSRSPGISKITIGGWKRLAG